VTIVASFHYASPGPGTFSGLVVVEGSPTIRGSGLQASSNSTFTVSLPAGSQAGDLAVVFFGAAYDATGTPSGWTAYADYGAGLPWWGGRIYTRTLDAGDISTGSMSVTFTSSYDAVLGIVVFAGAPTLRESQGARDTAMLTTMDITTSSSVAGTDLVICFGSTRASSSNSLTVSAGVPSLLQTADDSANASGFLYSATTVTPASGGASYGMIL